MRLLACGISAMYPFFMRQAFEIQKDAIFQNMCTMLGFLKCLNLCMRLEPLGLLYGAIPCDSFSFMSSNCHERSSFHPFGSTRQFVYEGNCMATRFAILALVCLVRRVMWACENPARSVLDSLPPMQRLLDPCLFPFKATWRGSYVV